MAARVKFWIYINVYALLLDVLGCVAFGIAFLVFKTWLAAAIVFCVAAVYLLHNGFKIHSTYSEKCRIYNTLIRRNKNGIQRESFKKFLSVPCHRIIVRMVLARLRQESIYRELIRAYYIPPWKRGFSTKTTYRIFKTKEEGDQWLLEQGGGRI
jgi:hypothetical protein